MSVRNRRLEKSYTRLYLPPEKRTRLIVNCQWGSCLWRRWHVWKRNVFIYILLCVFVEDKSPNISEGNLVEEKDPYLEWGEDFSVSDDREEYWKEVV